MDDLSKSLISSDIGCIIDHVCFKSCAMTCSLLGISNVQNLIVPLIGCFLGNSNIFELQEKSVYWLMQRIKHGTNPIIDRVLYSI